MPCMLHFLVYSFQSATLLAEFERSIRELLERSFDGILVITLHLVFKVGDGGFDAASGLSGDLVAMFLQRLSGRIDQLLRLIPGFHQRTLFSIFTGMGFRIGLHLV